MENFTSVKLLILVTTASLLAPTASACLTSFSQQNILHEPVGEEMSAEHIIGYGQIVSEIEGIEPDTSQVSDDLKLLASLSKSRVMIRIASSDAYPELVGQKVAARYFGPTSCGPYPSIGQRGYLVGEILSTDEHDLPADVVVRTQSGGERYELRKKAFLLEAAK